MGDWCLTVRAVGTHGSPTSPEDASRLAADFVETCKAKGHHVKLAVVTHGAEVDVTAGEEYVRWCKQLAPE